MNSCLYEGRVRHRRFAPRLHTFEYPIFYVYLDLDELHEAFGGRWLWSARRPALAWFRRADHLGPVDRPLKDAVADVVERHCGRRPRGPIRLLTQLRYFGYVFNPVSFYYCFDPTGARVETVVAEVTNTPWGERHLYVLRTNPDVGAARHARFQLRKEFHVSPFMPMDIDYDWILTSPEQRLSVHMKNYRAGHRLFDATLNLDKRPLTGANCARVLVRYPLMTAKIMATIYWQALKLWLKGAPVYDHPTKAEQPNGGEKNSKPV